MNPTPKWMRLAAAALLLAALYFPARADDDRSTADQAQAALGGGRLGDLYTGGRRLPQDTPTVPRKPAAVVQGGIDQARVDKCLAGAALDDKQKAFFKEMTDRLQTTDDGRRTLERMIQDCENGSGSPVAVSAPEFKGSTIINSRGVEGIAGISGMSHTGQKERKFMFNRLFLDFKDHNAAIQMAAANMGHELNHLLLDSEFRALLKDYADVLQFALIDEQNARVKGFLVAYELAKDGDKLNGATREARDFAADPQGFFAEMKTWDKYYAVGLQQRELRDPIAAYQDRIVKLTKLQKEDEEELADIPLHLDQIDHMLKTHAELLKQKDLVRPVTLLRERTAKLTDNLAVEITEVKDSIKRVNELIAQLQDPKTGPPFLAKLKALSYDPDYARIVARHQLDIERLQQLVQQKKLVDAPEADRPMTLVDFLKLFKELHGTDGPQPWNEK